MIVNRLDKDELIYELTVRGIESGNVEAMRSRLSLALQMEKSGDSLKYPDCPYGFTEDHDAVKKGGDEIMGLLAKFDGDKKSNDGQKIQTKLAHVLGRLDNMTPTDKAESEKKATMAALVLTILGKFEDKVKEVEGRGRTSVPAATVANDITDGDGGPLDIVTDLNFAEGLAEAQGSSPRSRSRAIDANPGVTTQEIRLRDQRASATVGAQPDTSGSFGAIKPMLPSKWNLKFSGTPKGMSLSAFLERVEELRVSRHVSKEILFESGIDLFTGRAYQYYQDIRNFVHSWDELVEEFKAEFHRHDHDVNLLREIDKRTQGKDESIGIYMAVMNSFFGRLHVPISEGEKLNYLMRNIRPKYQQGLGFREVGSVSELRQLCRRIESRDRYVETFHEPPSCRSSTMEPDLAYIGELEDGVTAVGIAASDGAPSSGRSNPGTIGRPNNKGQLLCFKCNEPGHKAIGCLMPGKKQCFRCGKNGFTVRTCPGCSKSGNALQRPQ